MGAGLRRAKSISERVRDGAVVIVNGRRVPATVRNLRTDRISIELETLPAPGMHFLQVQNPSGLFSNDFIFHPKIQ